MFRHAKPSDLVPHSRPTVLSFKSFAVMETRILCPKPRRPNLNQHFHQDLSRVYYSVLTEGPSAIIQTPTSEPLCVI